MKRQLTLFAIIGIAAVCAFSITLISSAQPNIQPNIRQMPDRRPAVAQFKKDAGRNRKPGAKPGFGLKLAGIDLSDEQQEQIRQQIRDFQVNTAELRQKLQFTEQDVRRAMRDESVDQAGLDSLWADIASLRAQLGQAQTNHMLTLKGILTPEQLALIQDNERLALEVQKLRLEERELILASGAPDMQRLQQIQAEMAQKETALERERFDDLAERFANLTPEEQDQFRTTRARVKPAPGRR